VLGALEVLKHKMKLKQNLVIQAWYLRGSNEIINDS
jgi:hypothetical protein